MHRETTRLRRIVVHDLARSLLRVVHTKSRGARMHRTDALKAALRDNLLQRGLRALHGQLAFVHRGRIVQLAVDESLYRGPFVVVLEQGRPVREFRAHDGAYDWNAIANAIVDVAEGRPATHGRAGTRTGAEGANRKLADDLNAMLGPGVSPLTIEPSAATPGRVRVKLSEIELDPLAVLQLFAALARALPESAHAH
jgi:hypothetical protein